MKIRQRNNEIAAAIWRDVCLIRDRAPLVHNITNYVAMNFSANALLAIGASPVMAHAIEEAAEMAGQAMSLVLNIGTPSPRWVAAMIKAGKEARRRKIPVVVDPVGSGATGFRTTTARMLLREVRPTIVRGNASEILSLVRKGAGTKGVDSAATPCQAQRESSALSRRAGCCVSVSGPQDAIFGNGCSAWVRNGHPIMARVTGMGCTATAVTAAFAAVNPSPFFAAVHAMAVMGVAGEIAAEKCPGPGTFTTAFLDKLYSIDISDLSRRLDIAIEGAGGGACANA
jgi:hydroxyethylthiazole kinase